MDHVIGGLAPVLGFALSPGLPRIKALAYADDLILFASTPEGLQVLIDSAVGRLGECGLSINADKSRSHTLTAAAGRKLVKLESGRVYRVGNDMIGALSIDDTFEYLGVSFCPYGLVCDNVDLCESLERISKAPLKPQQKLEVLKTFFLPRFYHRLTFGVTRRLVLTALDVRIRSYVRKWLRLPHDALNVFIHTPVKFGGLGVPRLAKFVPYMREKRFLGVDDELEDLGLDDSLRELLFDFPSGLLPPHPFYSECSLLTAHFDGMVLASAGDVPASTAWVSRSSSSLSGRDWTQFIGLRAGALPTAVRLTRGRRDNLPLCRAACGVPESAAHVINHCPLVKNVVILRHHAVVKLLVASLRGLGMKCLREPTLRTVNGIYRPDVVAVKDRELFIIDVTIVSGDGSFLSASVAKKRRYGRKEVFAAASSVLGSQPARSVVIPVIMNYKGVWCPKSAMTLRRIGVSSRVLGWMTIRTLRGSCANFTTWQRAMITLMPVADPS